MDSSIRRQDRSILGIFSICFLIYCAAFIYRTSFVAIDGRRYFCLFDDAMISMRYAWNFSHGLGLVWNPGEYVQGYTNLLTTLLMSCATLIGDKSGAVFLVQVFGAGCMLGVALVTTKISDHIVQHDTPWRSTCRRLAFMWGLAYYPLVYWSLMGMETGLLTLLLLSGVLAALNYTSHFDRFSLFQAAACFGLAYLTRNDSLPLALLVWAYVASTRVVSNSGGSLHALPSVLLALGLYASFVVGQSTFQYLYYGDLVPNTYTLKLTGMTLATRLDNGIRFVTPFLAGSAFVLVLSAVGIILECQPRKVLLASLFICAVAYTVYVGGDAWNYWRMTAPTMPLLAILFVSASKAIVVRVSNSRLFQTRSYYNSTVPGGSADRLLTVVCAVAGLLSVNAQFFDRIPLLQKPWETRANMKRVNIAVALTHVTAKDASVGVYAAGAIPYFADRSAIDFLGKSDKRIARLPPDLSGSVPWPGLYRPGHNKYDLNYSIKTLRPTFVEDFRWGAQDLYAWADDHYVKVVYKGIDLFLVKDSPLVFWQKLKRRDRVNAIAR